ncbi:hypothetical protein [uncultured Thiothrix sp.]|uniref:hypothetical protein n=1 Tax=uncultured Thiothrix sp. TaxID=223185 RepID=UPI002629AFCB|nr:hypothetical protein [uncultured Thiothrix sp.]HMT93674.1 hypothetical protein [Thiolinea sp.]
MKLFKPSLTLLILASLSLTMGACREMPSHQGSLQTTSAEDAQFVKKTSELQAKNPKQDAQAALARGERYFLCNAGRSRTVPGLTAEVYAKASERCPTQCLDGVTDALYGENHAKYLSAALEYSAQWNQVIVKACN